MNTIKLPEITAPLLNALTIEIDCFCNFTSGVFGGWDLTGDAEKSIKFIMMNFCDGDMTVNKLATIINNGEYVIEG